MAKKQKPNYLDFVPSCREGLRWSENEEGIIVLEIDHKGVYNKIAQKLFRKPKVSYISLDQYGTCVWKQIDGQKTVYDIAHAVEEQFQEQRDSHLQRIVKYFHILDSNHFVSLKK